MQLDDEISPPYNYYVYRRYDDGEEILEEIGNVRSFAEQRLNQILLAGDPIVAEIQIWPTGQGYAR